MSERSLKKIPHQSLKNCGRYGAVSNYLISKTGKRFQCFSHDSFLVPETRKETAHAKSFQMAKLRSFAYASVNRKWLIKSTGASAATLETPIGWIFKKQRSAKKFSVEEREITNLISTLLYENRKQVLTQILHWNNVLNVL